MFGIFRKLFFSLSILSLVGFLVSCHHQRHLVRAPASVGDVSCLELMEGLLPYYRLPLLKKIDAKATLTIIESAFFSGFISYVRSSADNKTEVIVRRMGNGEVIFNKELKDAMDEIERVYFDFKKGRLGVIKSSGKVSRIGGFNLKVVKRSPISDYEVLEIMKQGPYDIRRLPTIHLQMFRFFKKGIVDFLSGVDPLRFSLRELITVLLE